jgi:3'(2'), 5'-bisphosphate nucleotidase
MTAANDTALTEAILAIALEAGDEILRICRGPLDARSKSDGTPVTEADLAADRVIVGALVHLAPDILIVSEESAPDIRPGTNQFWLVDPLDGTRELIAGRGEYTVNIALIRGGAPVLGVVHAPTLGQTYFASGLGRAFFIEGESAAQAISVRQPKPGALVALASRSHRDAVTDAYLREHGVTETRAIGSSIKFCLLAKGDADLYPRFGRTMEWDTAAGHAVLAAAGGSVKTLDGADLRYRKPGLENPAFVASGAPA